MDEKKEKILVVPDVHGRRFWEKVKDAPLDMPIVFLGDYLDPYRQEGISPDDAINNFKDILEFVGMNKERVTLLLGNHDAHYIGLSDDSCRMDIFRSGDILDLFRSVRDSIKILYEWKDTIFSHAGVVKGWMNVNGFGETDLIRDVNEILEKHEWQSKYTPTPIGDISFYRGGCDVSGSPIWADIEEHLEKPGITKKQIFAHTRLIEEGKIVERPGWIMCDSRAVFEYSGTTLIPYI